MCRIISVRVKHSQKLYRTMNVVCVVYWRTYKTGRDSYHNCYTNIVILRILCITWYVPNMQLNEQYQVYSDDKGEENPRSNLCSRICSCLFTYTFGSCRYFRKSGITLSHEDRVELRTLWKSQDPSIGRGYTNAQGKEDHWKQKTREADRLMRKRILYHFKDHIRKWKDSDRPRFPWKMILHILLVIVVTVQVRIRDIWEAALANTFCTPSCDQNKSQQSTTVKPH